MANTFVTVSVPLTPGVGAAVDVSTMGATHTIIVGGNAVGGYVILEGSQDGNVFAPALTIDLVNDPKIMSLEGAFAFLRARRVFGHGTITIAIGGEVVSGNLFSNAIDVPTPGSDGTPIDVSDYPPVKSIVLVGGYKGTIVALGSVDGTNYDPIATFRTGASEVITLTGVYSNVRLRRIGSDDGTPDVRIGGTSAIAGTGNVYEFDEDFGLTELPGHIVRQKVDDETLVFNDDGEFSVVQGSSLVQDYIETNLNYYWGGSLYDGPPPTTTSNPTAQEDTLLAWPNLFRQPGTLTILDIQWNNSPLVVGSECYVAIYDNVPGDVYPRNLLFSEFIDVQRTSATAMVIYRMLPNLVVAKNDILWLTLIYNAALGASTTAFWVFNTTFNYVGIDLPAFAPGKNQDASYPNLGLLDFPAGWAHDFAFAAPPATFPTASPRRLQSGNTTDGVWASVRFSGQYQFNQDTIP